MELFRLSLAAAALLLSGKPTFGWIYIIVLAVSPILKVVWQQ